MNKSICHGSDDRVSSFKSEIGRALPSKTGRIGRRRYASACTITMISKDCAISAGHCLRNLNYIQFQVPQTNQDRRINHPEKQDIYRVKKDTIKYRNDGGGEDWAVFKIQRNSETGLYPGQAQGFLQVDFSYPSATLLEITGYGMDYSPVTSHYTQQTDDGEFVEFEGKMLHHLVDTTGGNSGSSIVDKATGKVIGVHSHGGCTTGADRNTGTSIYFNTEFKMAIKSCLSKTSQESLFQF